MSETGSLPMPPMPPMPPTPLMPSVPGFELRRLLGRGAQAEVWLATDLAAAEPVALKFRTGSQPGVAGRRQQTAQVRELAALRRIDHPHIVRLRRVAQVAGGGGTALVLEYAPGGSLADLVAARGRLDPAEVTSLLVPLARALAHLHERGLVHGDLSAGNVLFAADGRPLLADLGAASVLGLGQDPGLGTSGFADPEQTGPADPAADVRALGAIGWFALSGAAPDLGTDGRPSGTAGEVAARLVRQRQRAASEAGEEAEEAGHLDPTALVEVLAGCLQGDRQHRPSAVDLVRLAWAAAAPVPIRLVSWMGGGDPDDEAPDPVSPTDVTRRLRAAATATPVQAPRRRALRWPLLRGSVGRFGDGVGGRGRSAGLVVAVALAAVGGWLLVTPGRPAAGQAPLAPRAQPAVVQRLTAEQATALLTRLAADRARAIQARSVSALALVDEPGSAAMRADLALLDRLAANRVRMAGLRFELSAVQVVERSAGTVTVSLGVSSSAHRLVPTAGGREVLVPADPVRRVRLVLVRTGTERWRVREVSS